MIRIILLLLVALALVHLTVQFTLEKRGAAWFLRPNWKPPTKRFFYPDGTRIAAIAPNDFDQYIIY
ncbi:Protein CBG23893 [Caenorhabditis briggsae]|uniref:Protein CBG23893 n=1 Tax=Caenorhabditis briggsae TaxID=6238 RepID=A8WJI8_CAEBR|nr:Protein CBG23893 [Caenorhabditis briggsae]CAP20631.1 Protein CBG23893 [Caenorhabditis briggsae]